MKQKRSIKKYLAQGNINQSISSNHLSDIREQLRQTMQQLQQYKLSSQFQTQKRMIAQQQNLILKQQNKELRQQLQQIKRQLGKFSKKLSKIKQQKNCDKCKNQKQTKQKAEKERQVFIKQRTVLRNQISELKKILENHSEAESQSRINISNVDTLHRQIEYKNRTIEDQKKIIKYLDDKLSNFELEKLQTLSYVQQVDQRMQQLQMENLIIKGSGKYTLSPSRKNGSIKNLQRQKSKVSKQSPTCY